MGKAKLYICRICNKEFTRYSGTDNPDPKCCSRKCQGKYFKTALLGENNPNYNHRWPRKLRKSQSIRMKKCMKDPIRRYKAGSANRGKKFSKEHIQKISEGHKGLKHPPHTKKQKKLIGKWSKEKFLKPGYWERVRKVYEEKGLWIPIKYKSEYKLYCKISNWRLRMFDLLPDEMITKLKQLGVFHYKTNKNGLVRDHIFSRMDGFYLGVFPEILRHPANCQLLTRLENISKGRNSWITINQLFELIEEYVKPWEEQGLCLQLINKYKVGARFKIDKEDPIFIRIYNGENIYE